MAYSDQDIQGFYQKYLGRGYSDPGEGQGWLNDPNAEANIKNSGEGQAWATKQANGTVNSDPAGQQPQTPTNQWSSQAAPTVDPYARNAFRDAWGASADHSTAGLDALIKSDPRFASITRNGDVATLPGYTEAGTGIYRGPERLDVIGDVGGANRWAWSGLDGGGGGNPAGGAIGAGQAGAATGGGQASAVSNDPMRQQLVDALTKRSQQSLAVDRNDPNIRGQADAYAAQQERSRRDYLAQQAETQGPLSNLTGEARLTAEKTGQANGGFEAALMGQEITARRKEIQDALTQMQGQLTAEQQMALQKELGQLDDATRRFGIQTQADTAQSGINNDWQKALMSNTQFMDELGLKSENQYNYWDAVNSGKINGGN